ncbi:hypothetical protein MNBD_ALPHA11-470 [hydrothermal vent metagenome]|uniref:DUF3291 domain-containing protein n=1 Tax=hydrothermal vent metagenome TaxID=652676 RepID=A0A3B0T4Y7_9ZZZZ
MHLALINIAKAKYSMDNSRMSGFVNNLDALENYTYRTIHKRVFTSRNNWFDKIDGAHMALWWINEGETPTIEEGKRRLQMIADNGS